MRARRTLLIAAAAGLVLAGCGSNNEEELVGPQSGGSEGSGNPTDLVVLEDDQGLQPVDNIVPLVNRSALKQPMREALNAVSEALTTETLIDLNRRADLQRQSPEAVAEEFVEQEGLAEGVDGGSGSVVVGAANFSENQILANVYALALEGAGYTAEVKTVGNREVYLPALRSGELTVVPEYTGTVAEFLNRQKNGPDAAPVASSDLDATLQALRPLAQQAGLEALEPAQATNSNAFAVTRRFAEENELRTLSDLADVEGGITLGGPPECPDRPLCQPGLEQTYDIEVARFVALDAGGPLTKTALKQGRVDVGLVFSTDGSLATLDQE